MDDFITGVKNMDDAIKLSKGASEIMAGKSMTLLKWDTNSQELLNIWTKNEDVETVDIKGQNPLKVLGLSWKPYSDQFMFETDELIEHLNRKSDTKRGVFQTAACIFDPVGFLSSFTIRVKCLFQTMWERGILWDENLPSDLQIKWHQ